MGKPFCGKTRIYKPGERERTEMAKLIAPVLVLTWLLIANSSQAKTLQLTLYAQASLPPKLTLKEEPVGGLSGMYWDGTKLVAVSDDRGKFGPPRFYDLDLKISAGAVKMAVTQVLHITHAPPDWILDLEAIVPLSQTPNGDLLLSTEGDNNHKPRAMPHIFMTSSTGVYKEDISLPDKFLPEPTGLQKKGIENNRGFEGVTLTPDGQKIFIMNEYPIIADQGESDSNLWLRLVEFKKDKASFKAEAEFPYLLTKSTKTATGIEVFRGVSELLYVNETQLIVLERGARLTKKGIVYTGGLYLADTTGAKDIAAVKNLSEGKVTALKKELLVDFEEILKDQKVENFEALAWGPALADGRKSLLVMSDNNFAAKEKTTLLVFAVKEVE
ncbi:MAG: esterase-like activity of phytase family protein [Pseudobdellovibrionaceae bacterium]